MKIVESIMTKNPCYTAGRKITVKGLMLHSVGCSQPSAAVFIGLWNRESYGYSCVHGIIDANDGTVYQTLPWDHRGWHAGGSANDTHIGVEMCEPDCIRYGAGGSFTCRNMDRAKEMVKRTYEAAVELFAHLCKEYNLDPMADGVIISHREGGKRGIASGHGDPEHLWNGLGMGYTMDTFRKAVKAAMGDEPAKADYTIGMRELRKGCRGEDVRALQILLSGRGYSCGIGGIDGDFGSVTESALKRYQADHLAACVAVDGVAGKRTMRNLIGISH